MLILSSYIRVIFQAERPVTQAAVRMVIQVHLIFLFVVIKRLLSGHLLSLVVIGGHWWSFIVFLRLNSHLMTIHGHQCPIRRRGT